VVDHLVSEDRLSEFFGVVLPILDEHQRRVVVGAASKMFGYGGVSAVKRICGISRGTVSRGMDEIDTGVGDMTRVRARGGGRKSLSTSQPELDATLDVLVEPESRGDPMSEVRWTTKSLRNLAKELVKRGFTVSHTTLRRMLKSKNYSLQGTAKILEGSDHPDRDEQFRYIAGLVEQFKAEGQPLTSADGKKKENIGQYDNGGREWRPRGEPIPVKDHDFPQPGMPKAVPYGVYDMTRNEAWVSVGMSADTAEFAVNSLRKWWYELGSRAYQNARKLLITVDAGGSNGYRNRLWKKLLAEFAVEIGLEITVCHYPPGTSKWNKIEHRLFSQITRNWRGRPLDSFESVVKLIGSTITSKGLKVAAALDDSVYKKGIKVSDAELAALPIRYHEFHGDWNYTVGVRESIC
jgi:transposase